VLLPSHRRRRYTMAVRSSVASTGRSAARSTCARWRGWGRPRP